MKNTIGKPTPTDRYQLSTSLRIQGSGGLDFDEISQILKTSASKTIKKGTSSRTGRVHEVDTWALDSEVPENEPLESHLRWFSQKFSDAEAIGKVRNLLGVEDVDVFCAVSAASTVCRISLPADLLIALRTMRLDLELSLVFGTTQADAVSDGAQMEVEPSWARDELFESASAALRGRFLPSFQVVMLDALRLSLEGDLATTLASPELEKGVDLALRTHMTEGSSLDSKLRELDETLRGSVQQLLMLGETDSFVIEGRFETNCEWASTGLSYQSLNLPISLSCPMTVEVALV
jgi:hypothetical protein